MSGTLWTIVIAVAIAALLGLALRSLIRERKNGGCSGNCSGCSGCSHSSHEK